MDRLLFLLAGLVATSWMALDASAQDFPILAPLKLLNGEKYIPTSKLHTITGAVTDSSGNPITGVDLAILQSHPMGHGQGIAAKAKTDEKGKFSMEATFITYPKTDPFIPQGSNSFQISVIDEITNSQFVVKWQLNPENVPENIAFRFPAMTYARINVESEAPNTVLGNVEVYISSDCPELNRDRKSGEPVKQFHAIAKSDVHGTAYLPVPVGVMSFGYNAVGAFEGCNQHVSQLKVPEQVQWRMQHDSEPFLITRSFNTMYHFAGIEEGVTGPAIQFEAKENEFCEVEIKIPESGIGKDPWGQ